jgi:hypothetical protein
MLIKFLMSITLASIAVTADSSEQRLDVIGLVPGVSELDDVYQASYRIVGVGRVSLVVGGYLMPCSVDFINGKLSLLKCKTGREHLGSSARIWTEASNLEVHRTLKKGFSNKFGPPTTVGELPVRTPTGVQYSNEIVHWTDSLGNAVIIMSLDGQVNEGSLSLISREALETQKKKQVDEDAKRKF